jgi:hypothetical protein
MTDTGGRLYNASCSISESNNRLTNTNLQIKADEIVAAKIKHVRRVKEIERANMKLKKSN